MAIRIPILTSFDPKGLKQANAQFAKLGTSVGSLGRNFAVLGAAIAGAGALIAKNVQSLARIEKINAQTAQTIKSMGDVAGISASGVSKLAGSLENLTATEAETIQEGANLLLTFRNIQNQAGAGNDIFNQTTAVMVDLARAMGTSASGEAIRLGKALNDPVKGIAALTRVGVSFTEQQKEQIKALASSGDLLGAQKVILAELQAQFGGSGAAFAQTFSGQLELMGHELGTIGEEATMSVMPALQGMTTQLRELIPVIGPQLKAAIESVDFVALGQAVVNFTTFLVNNAEAIAKTIAAIFIISTAYKTLAVAVGISKVAIALHTWAVAQAAAGMTVATVATGALRAALLLLPWVAVAAGIGLVIAGIMETDSSYRTTTPVVTSFGTAILKTGQDAEWAAGKYGVATTAVDKLATAISRMPKIGKIDIPVVGGGRGLDLSGIPRTVVDSNAGAAALAGATGATGSGAKQTSFAQSLKKQVTLANKTGKLIGAGLSEGLAEAITSSAQPIKEANKILQKIAETGGKAATKLQRQFNKTAAGQAEVEKKQADNLAYWEDLRDTAAESARLVAQEQEELAREEAQLAQEMQQQAEELARAQQEALDEQARKEAEALAERERIYSSFLDSVKNTFGSIKDSILGAFDLKDLGGSTNAITRNMEKLLVKVRSFATNVSKLSSMGLDPALLQQVISAGPLAGARLAQTLVAGGANALGSINAGFAEIGSLSSMIAQTGTESRFGTEAQQNIYNINIDGGVGSGATIGKSIVDAIKAYERTSGAVWVGA